MCAADTASYMVSEPMKPEKQPAQFRRVRKTARALAVFAATAVFGCIDSSMEAFTLEEAARSVCERRLLIAQVVACVAFLIAGYAVVSWRRQGCVVFADGAADPRVESVAASCLSTEEISQVSTQATCSQSACIDADFAALFDDFDSSISAELQDQFSTVMDALEVEQTQRLSEAAFDTRGLMQEAVRAFDASCREDKQCATTQTAPAQADFNIEEALNRLEQDVQRRSSGRIGQTSIWPKLNPLMVASLVGTLGLGGACADHLQAAENGSSTLVEVGIVAVFMPMGYVFFSRLRLANFSSTR